MWILFLGKTKPGKIHDYKLLRNDSFLEAIHEAVSTWVDKGFDGIQNLFSNFEALVPFKKRKNTPLTDEQKDYNKLVSSLRIKNEHAICGIKRFGVVTQRYRNRCNKLSDTFMLLAAGHWNLHLLVQLAGMVS